MGTYRLICKIGRTRLRKSISGSHLEAPQLDPPIQLRCLFSLSRNNCRKPGLHRLQQHHCRGIRKWMAGYSARREVRAMNYQSALHRTTYLSMTGLPSAATKGGSSVRFDPCPITREQDLSTNTITVGSPSMKAPVNEILVPATQPETSTDRNTQKEEKQDTNGAGSHPVSASESPQNATIPERPRASRVTQLEKRQKSRSPQQDETRPARRRSSRQSSSPAAQRDNQTSTKDVRRRGDPNTMEARAQDEQKQRLLAPSPRLPRTTIKLIKGHHLGMRSGQSLSVPSLAMPRARARSLQEMRRYKKNPNKFRRTRFEMSQRIPLLKHLRSRNAVVGDVLLLRERQI